MFMKRVMLGACIVAFGSTPTAHAEPPPRMSDYVCEEKCDAPYRMKLRELKAELAAFIVQEEDEATYGHDVLLQSGAHQYAAFLINLKRRYIRNEELRLAAANAVCKQPCYVTTTQLECRQGCYSQTAEEVLRIRAQQNLDYQAAAFFYGDDWNDTTGEEFNLALTRISQAADAAIGVQDANEQACVLRCDEIDAKTNGFFLFPDVATPPKVSSPMTSTQLLADFEALHNPLPVSNPPPLQQQLLELPPSVGALFPTAAP